MKTTTSFSRFTSKLKLKRQRKETTKNSKQNEKIQKPKPCHMYAHLNEIQLTYNELYMKIIDGPFNEGTIKDIRGGDLNVNLHIILQS